MTNEEFIESIRLDGEEWRDIPGMEGFYAASTEGRIISLGRYVRRHNGHMAYNPPRLRSFGVLPKGYLTLVVYMNGIPKNAYVALLVAKTFIPNPECKPCIDHIDTNKSNNRVSNLRWCTPWENQYNPLTEKHRKENPPDLSKQYIPVIALKNGRIVKKYKSLTDAKRDGYHMYCVRSVCSGKRKSHGGLQWMYLSDYEKAISSSSSPE